MHVQEWGAGDPVIALHPLALESTAFAGVAKTLAQRGLRTLAADLPGFGQTPMNADRLTPANLAAPVIELARSLETPPVILGMSMGGRVAIEAVLTAPESFRAAVLLAPYLPWRRRRWRLSLASRINPESAERLPLERAWPLLKRVAERMEAVPRFEHDWLARACVRFVYYSSCSATRVAFLSAARELALDPAFGRQGLWTRLGRIAVPAHFTWAGRDSLIPKEHARHVSETLRQSRHIEVPCAGHFVNGEHYGCMEHAIAISVDHAIARANDEGWRRRRPRVRHSLAPCLVADGRSRASAPEMQKLPRGLRLRTSGGET